MEYQRTVFSLLLPDDANPSELSSLSDSLTLDDGKGSGMLSVHVFTLSYYILD